MAFGKVFMSHKSENKDFVEYIVNKIGKDRCVYDKYTFEEGNETLQEIFRGMSQSDLFVIFLTKNALKSSWVKRELSDAYKRLNNNQLSAIFPLIIEEDLKYDDALIPRWMQNKYNIQHILSPKIATEKILNKLRELTWNMGEESNCNPPFFGRNDEVKKFETRFSNLELDNIVCVVASGFDFIGRKRYIEYCLKKLTIMRDTYKYSLITLDREEGLDDFIFKLDDLGLIPNTTARAGIISMSKSEKIKYVCSSIIKIQDLNHFIFINDYGILVKPDGKLNTWFEEIVDSIHNCTVFGIASLYKLKNSQLKTSRIFSTNILELSKSERQAMLIKTCKDLNLEVSKEDLKTISGILSGYPQQVTLAASMIDEEGISHTIKNLSTIRDYANDKAQIQIKKFEKDENAMSFLAFLCNLDFIDTEMLDKIFDENKVLQNTFHSFLSMSVCGFIGSDRQYVTVSNIIRDYISRSKIEQSEYYKHLTNSLSEENITSEWADDVTLAKYYVTIKQKILSGDLPPKELVLPSHYVKSIVHLYNSQKYSNVVSISRVILENNTDESFDSELRREFYTYFCQSLAREHNDDFFQYYKHSSLQKSDSLFLLGFYYRINNNPNKAINSLLEAIDLGNNSPRTKRELVNSYIILDDYESALKYSQENYESDTSNPFYIQSYFKCLINNSNPVPSSILEELLENIGRCNYSVANEMKAELQALYYYHVKKDASLAIGELKSAIKHSEKKVYLLMTLFDISFLASDIDNMREAITQLSNEVENKQYYLNAYYVRKAKLCYAEKEPRNTIQKYISKLQNYPEKDKARLIERLELK